MASEEPQDSKTRPARKSVAFTEEQIVVDSDGSVTMVAASVDDSKETAQSHSPIAADGAGDDSTAALGGEDELDLKAMKKKKKKALPVEGDAEEGDGAAGEEGLDLSLKKRKKKKAPKADDDFAEKLKALELEGGAAGEGGADEEGAAADETQQGDMDVGTGIWQHDASTPIVYDLLLSRFFNLLAQKNPDHASSGAKSYKIPPPQCMREGNKKTIFANIAEISKRMNRDPAHVTSYLFAELGTSGSVDGSERLVIKGRFQGKQIENVLRKYIIEYVSCRTCRSPNTELKRGENRLYFLECKSCGSRRSVTAIKTGFSAQIGKRKKMQG